jgi:hypothetical protein
MHGTSENIEGVGSLLVSFLRSASSLCVSVDDSPCLHCDATLVRLACHQPLLIVDDFVRKRTKKRCKGIVATALASKRVVITGRNKDERLHVTTVRCKKGRAYTVAMHRDYIIAGKEVNRHAHWELVFRPKPSCEANQCSPDNRIASTTSNAKPFSRVFNHYGRCSSHQVQFIVASRRSIRQRLPASSGLLKSFVVPASSSLFPPKGGTTNVARTTSQFSRATCSEPSPPRRRLDLDHPAREHWLRCRGRLVGKS